jgi:hypothetical protein
MKKYIMKVLLVIGILLLVGLVCLKYINIKPVKNPIIIEQNLFCFEGEITNNISVYQSGNKVDITDLPTNIYYKLEQMYTRKFPQMKLNPGTVKDVLYILFAENKPITRSIGLIYPPEEQNSKQWIENLDIADYEIMCTLTNVSFLEFALVLSRETKYNLVIDASGQPLFTRNKNRDFVLKKHHR